MYGMQNMTVRVKGSKMILEVDLTKDLNYVTQKGGNIMVATSGNWRKPPELPGFHLNFVLTKDPDAKIPQ